jgi:GT2 family glycosyltransferase
MLVDYLYAYYNRDGSRPTFLTTNNLAVAGEPFRAIGGFDGRFRLAAAEDREFCDRWHHAGHPLLYAPEAVVYHAHVLTFRSFCRQHFSYGRGAYHYHQRRAARGEAFAIEPPRFYTGLVWYPRAHRARHWPRLTALLAVTQVANALGFLWERATDRKIRRQNEAIRSSAISRP